MSKRSSRILQLRACDAALQMHPEPLNVPVPQDDASKLIAGLCHEFQDAKTAAQDIVANNSTSKALVVSVARHCDTLTGLLHESINKQGCVEVPKGIWRDIPASLKVKLKHPVGSQLSECSTAAEDESPVGDAQSSRIQPQSREPEVVAITQLVGCIGRCLQNAKTVAVDAAEVLRLPGDPRSVTGEPAPGGAEAGKGKQPAAGVLEAATDSTTHSEGEPEDALQTWLRSKSVDAQLHALLARLEADAADLRGLAHVIGGEPAAE